MNGHKNSLIKWIWGLCLAPAVVLGSAVFAMQNLVNVDGLAIYLPLILKDYHSLPPTSTPTPTITPTSISTLLPPPTDMVFVPAGAFFMGCDPAHNGSWSTCEEYSKFGNFTDELPLHTIYLDAYFIDQYEVTNSRYARCVAEGGVPYQAVHPLSPEPPTMIILSTLTTQ